MATIIGTLAGDGEVNQDEILSGFSVSGTTDAAGASYVIVRFLDAGRHLVGQSYAGSVTGTSWSVDLPADALGRLSSGSYTAIATVYDDNNAARAASPDFSFAVDATPPVASIVRDDPVATDAGTVSYTVTFSEAVTGVDASQFSLTTTGSVANPNPGATIESVSGTGTTYTVTVNSGNGNGTIALDLTGAAIRDLAGNGYSGGVFNVASGSPVAAGINPISVAVADLDGDGKLDIVTANESDNTVSVLLGNGDGTFRAQPADAVGTNPVSVAVSDVNGDGEPDIVTANVRDNTISVLLGEGGGAFQPQTTYTVGSDPYSVAVADVNRDGKPDIVTANTLDDTVSVLLGNGDGTFQAQPADAVGTNPYSVAVSDVNGDGNPDIVTANENDNTVSVLLGKGDGTFQAQTTDPVGSTPRSVAVADVNGDGKPDIVVANWGSNSVSVLLGNGAGAFTAQPTDAVENSPTSVAVADVNGDGKPDIVAANANSNTVSVLLGNGGGTFQAQTTDAVGANPFSVAVADLNGDGRPDIGTANLGSNNVSVLLNGPAQLVGPTYSIDQTPPEAPTIFSVADDVWPVTGLLASGDSTNDPDLAVQVTLPGNAIIGDIVQLYGSTDTSDPLGSAHALTAADISAGSVTLQTGTLSDNVTYDLTARVTDGLGQSGVSAAFTVIEHTIPPLLESIVDAGASPTDAATVSYTVTFSHDVTGVDASQFSLTTTGVSGANIASVSGSGSTYTVTANTGTGEGTIALDLTGAAIHDLAGSAYSGGVFTSASGSPEVGSEPTGLAAGDFNGDGKLDIVTVNDGSSTVSVLLGNGDGTFQAQTTDTVGIHPYAVAVADLNGDGKPDIVATNTGDNTVSVLLGEGGGAFQAQTTYTVGSNPYSVAVADLNGDGKPDIVTANLLSNTVSVLLGNGGGTFQAQMTDDVGTHPYSVAVADVNGDGKPDIVTANESDNTVSVLLGNGDGTFQAQTTDTVGTRPQAVAVADVNGDGKPDIVAANESDNTVSVLLGDGTGAFTAQPTDTVGTNPFSVAVADVNGDGKPDIVTANESDNTVSVLLNGGGGAFTAQPTHAVGTSPASVVLADLNGDGRLDIGTANLSSDNVSVLLNGPTEVIGPSYTIVDAPPAVTTSAGATAWHVAPVAIDGALTVTDSDNATLASATVSITGGFQAGEDALAFSNTDSTVYGNIAATYDSANGVLGLTSSGDTATVAQWQSALDAVTYTDSSVTPTLGNRTISFTANDGTDNSVAATKTLDVIADAAPAVAVPTTQTTEEDTPLVFSTANGNAIAVSDADDSSLTVSLATGGLSLTLATENGLTFSGGADGDWSMTFSGTIADINAALDGLVYVPYTDTPGPDVVEVTADDGLEQTTVDANINMNAVNDAPVLTPDAPTLTAVDVDNFSSGGQKISAIIGSSDNDPDGPGVARGIAITGETERGGSWQYSLDNGSTWANVPSGVAESAALVLRDSDYVRFLPDGSHLTGTETLTYRAWDQTDGSTAGTQVDITATGGATAFSDATDTASLSVIDNTPPALQSIVASDPTLTNAGTVHYTVTFSEPVTGVDASQFAVATTNGITEAKIASVSGSGTTYSVTVNTGSGDGALELQLNGSAIHDLAGNPYSGGTFLPATSYQAGFHASGLAIGDLNGDGNSDVVTADEGDATLAVLLGKGDGSLQTRTFAGAVGPLAVTIGDVDGDGTPDLLAANWFANSISVLRGSGGGAFLAKQDTAVGTEPVSLATGDFDGDGNLDVVTANSGSSNVSVLLGNGDGTFDAASGSPVTVGSNPVSVAVADLNGDGNLDIVAATAGGQSEVLLGKGDGTFTAQAGPMVGAFSNAIALGDVNGDGKLDMIAADDVSGKVDVLLGNGGGSFQTRVEYAAGSNPYSLALGDVNGDGKLDVVVADNNNSGTVSILLGNGDGSFQAPLTAAVGSDPTSVALADLNDDGQPDIVAANEGSSTVSVLLNGGVSYMVDKTADAPTIESVTDDIAPVTGALASGDSTNDPNLAVKIDLAADAAAGDTLQLYGSTDTSDPLGSAYTLTADDITATSVTLQTGRLADGTTYDLTARVTDSLGNQSDASAAFTVTEHTIPPTLTSIADADASPTNAATISYTVTFSEAVTGVDASQFSLTTTGGVTGESITNVSGSGSTYTVTVNTGSGDGTITLDLTGAAIHDLAGNAYSGGAFKAAVNYANGATPDAIASGDFDGDGVADLVTVDGSPDKVSVLLNNGDGTFGAATQYATDVNPAAVAVADIDGDGKLDIVTANSSTQSVSVLLGNGDGTFQAAKNFADVRLGGISDVAIGDFNGDGHPDIADTHDANGGKVSILLGTGDASLFPASPNHSYSLSGINAQPNALVTADFTGDGHLDLAVLDDTGHVDLFAGNSDGSFGAPSVLNVGSAPDAIAVGDFNGDGKPDIVTGNVNSSSVSVLINNGSGGFTRHDTSLSNGPATVAVGDFNGDGKLDIATDGTVAFNKIAVLFGNGNGTFQPETDYAVGSFPVAAVTGDFDGDGRSDLAVANGASNNVSVLLNGPPTLLGSGYTIDKTAPDTSITADPGAISGADVTFDFSGTDASGIASYQTSLDGAAAVDTADTSVSYTGLTHGDHTFDVAAVDAAGNVDATPATFTWAVDQATDVVNDSYSVNAESTLTVDAANGVLANDSDADADPFTAVKASDPSHGTLTFSTDGSFTYTPNAGFHGADSFIYEANDGFTNSTAATVNLTVNDLAPVANGESYTTDEDTPLTIPPGAGVLANDTDADPNDSLTAALVQGPSDGSLTLNADGSFTYTPGLNFNGSDSFTYKANDGTDDSNVATVDLTINAVNDPPTVNVSSPAVAWHHAAVAVAPAIAVGDVDNTTLASATVTIGAGFVLGEDVLTINGAVSGTFVGTDTGSIAYSYDSATGALALTGTDTLADYQQALAAVTYNDTAATPTLGQRDISFIANDGQDPSLAADKMVVVADQAPTIGVGALDLAVTNDSNNVGVFLGDGTGGFTATVDSPVGVGSGPEGIAVGDLNGDGNADLAVANWGADTVSLLYGDGRGGFGGGLTLTPFDGIGDGPASVALGDLDGDGKADLVVADNGYNSGGPSGVTVLLNSEIGSTAGSFIDLDTAPESVALGDMNGDGNLDIVTANNCGCDTVSVVYGIGGGAFDTNPADIGTFDVGASPSWVAVGDVNGDGLTDIVSANEDDSIVSVLLNEGDGDFTRTDVSTEDGNGDGTGPFSVSLGDLDGENGLDIVTANDDGTVSALLNDGQGGFDLTTYPVGAGPAATLGDVDGDGDLDIVTANYGDDTSSVLLNDGNGVFPQDGGLTFSTGGTSPEMPVLGHFDTARTINEDTPLVFSAAKKITIADADDDDQTVTLGVSHGTLALGAATGGLSSSSGNGSDSVTLSGTLSAVNAALDGLTYTPAANFNGADTLAIATGDGIEQAQSAVAITINPVNDAPTITVSDPAAVAEGNTGTPSPVTVNVADYVTIADPDVGDAATHYVAGTLAFSSSSSAPGGGNLAGLFTLDPANGTIAYDATAFDYLAGGATATATFSFNSSSGPDTLPEKITLTIDGENDAPVLAGDGNTVGYTERGTAVAIDPGLTVADVDSSTLVVASVTIADPLAGDALALNGTASGIFNSKIAYSFSGGALTLIGADSKADYQAALDAVTFSSTSHNPTNFGANPTRTVQWQVDDGQSDNHASNQASSTVAITAVDDPAVAQADAFSILETGTAAGSVFADNGSGADSDVDSALAVTAVNGSAMNVGSAITLASGALLTLNANGTFSYNPNHVFDYLAAPGSGASDTHATDTFTYTLNGQSTATVTVSITGVDSDDRVLGTAGNDRLDGGVGTDTLTGGAGSDTFVFAPGDGADTITDFTAGGAGHDKLDLTGFSDIRSLAGVLSRASTSGGNTVLDFGNGDTLTLDGVAKTSLKADDFVDLGLPHDFNGDGFSDVLWRNDDGRVATWDLRSDGGFNAQQIGGTSNAWQIQDTGDFNGDGFADILWRNADGTVATWDLNASVGVGGHSVGKMSNSWHIEGAGDFNGDRVSDILWQNDDGRVLTWDMLTNGTYGSQQFGATVSAWHIQGTGDFNGDGTDDILWQNDDGRVVTWDMRANGMPSTDSVGTMSASWHIQATGDFNGDGLSDILWRNDNGDTLAWNMQANGSYTSHDFGTVSKPWHIADTGDFNGDGFSDILWQNDNRQVVTWDLGADNTFSTHTIATPSSPWHVADNAHAGV